MLPLYLDTARPELHVTPIHGGFHAEEISILHPNSYDFAPKDTLNLVPTFLGRTVQVRGEKFIEKLLGGSDGSIIGMAVSNQFAWQLLFAHFANLLRLTGSESVPLWKPFRSSAVFRNMATPHTFRSNFVRPTQTLKVWDSISNGQSSQSMLQQSMQLGIWDLLSSTVYEARGWI